MQNNCSQQKKLLTSLQCNKHKIYLSLKNKFMNKTPQSRRLGRTHRQNHGYWWINSGWAACWMALACDWSRQRWRQQQLISHPRLPLAEPAARRDDAGKKLLLLFMPIVTYTINTCLKQGRPFNYGEKGFRLKVWLHVMSYWPMELLT